MVLCAEPPPKLKIPSKITEMTEYTNHDSPKLERRTRIHHIERHRSCVVTLSDMELNDSHPRCLLQTLEVSKSPGGGSQCSLHEETPTDTNASHRHAIADAAWEALKRLILYFRGQPIETVAAIDKSQGAALNYDQVFMRDFIPSALAFLMKGEHLIVKKFLVETACLQSREKMVDLFKLGQGVMSASFKVHHHNPTQKTESLLADFGETAIGRVAPVDSGLWWILLLGAYTRLTGDNSHAESPNCQRAMHLILRLCLSEGCDTSPALLCADGCSMIDRRMVFMRDFIPSALAFLMKGEHLVVKNFLVETARLQSREKMVDLFKPGQGVMPANFKVHHRNPTQKTESLLADFSETAIGKVAPVDSGLWWIILLGAYTRLTGDNSLAERPNCQRAVHLILRLCLSEGCDTSSSLLCADGCSMIDRRMVFMRDFIPSALAFLMKGEHLIVKNFLVETACLQSREKMVDLFKLGQGVMPASFKVHHHNPTQKTESLLADFGETAIGRVAPVDSDLWWILLLGAYTRLTGDNSHAESPNCQRAMHLILRLFLSEGCDTSPALLCADGCSMINQRMGVYGHPIEIQALFFIAMRCALSMLKQDSDADFVSHIMKQIKALRYHLRSYYWFDFQRRNDIYKTEEYSQTALNKFNVIPESIPDWISDFMPGRGGYFIGNISLARMDFHWFCLGNFVAILSPLATGEQAEAILYAVEERWEEIIRETPVKICYPAMENKECQIVTVCDPKNTRWSCHNGGSWPDEHALEMSSKEKGPVHGNFATFFVKIEGTSISVRKNLSITTTKMLLEHAYEKKGIRSYDGYALYLGKVLDDNKLLSDYKVCNDCIVEVRGRGRARGKIEIECTTFDDEMKGVDIYNVVPLPKTLTHRVTQNNSATFLSRHSQWCARQVLISLCRMHFRNKSFNGKFNASHILFHDGRVLFDKCCKDREVDFSGSSCKNDYRVIEKNFGRWFQLPSTQNQSSPLTSEGKQYPLHVKDLLKYLWDCPLGDKSNSALAIALLVNHPALITYMERIAQCSTLDSMVDRLTEDQKFDFDEAVLGFGSWSDVISEVPAMHDTLVYDPWSGSADPKAVPNSASDKECEENSYYTEDARGCLKFSRNHFRHAKLELFLERVEAAFSLNLEAFLPKILRDIVWKFEGPSKFDMITLLGDHVIDMKRKRDADVVNPPEMIAPPAKRQKISIAFKKK